MPNALNLCVDISRLNFRDSTWRRLILANLGLPQALAWERL